MQFLQLSHDRKVISLACSQVNCLGKVCPFSKIPFQFTQLMKQSTSLIAKPAITYLVEVDMKRKFLFSHKKVHEKQELTLLTVF